MRFLSAMFCALLNTILFVNRHHRVSLLLFFRRLYLRKILFFRHEVVQYAINALKNDYKFVTVAECLGELPYLSVADASARDVCLSFFLLA